MSNVFNMLGGGKAGLKPQVDITCETGSTITFDGTTLTEQQVVNPTWKNLPSGYTQVESITQSGASYIEVPNFYPTNNTRIKGTMKAPTTGSTWSLFFGCDYPEGKRKSMAWQPSNGFRMDYGNKIETASIVPTSNEFFDFDYNKNVLSINGTEAKSYTEQTFTCDVTLTIFAYHQNGTVWCVDNGVASQELLIYENDVLQYDLVPCKNSSDVVSFYDVKNGSFLTPTGTFTAGDEVPHYISSGTWTTQTTIGTHTIVATSSDQTKTATETVNVDEVGLYTVNIAFVTYLTSIPTMTSATTPSGEVTASSEDTDNTRYAWKAFDGVSAFANQWNTVYSPTYPAWIQYECESNYELKFNTVSIYNPTDDGYGTTSEGYIQTSNDGTTFTTVKSFSVSASDSFVAISIGSMITTPILRIVFTQRNNTYSSGRAVLWEASISGGE